MAADEDRLLKAARVDGTEEHPLTPYLPEDVLADVLRRVPPCWLAASRCVCRAWCDAVDAHRLLRADLLPLSFAGLFVHFNEHKYPEFFACPSSEDAAHAVSGDLSFMPSSPGTIWEHRDDWHGYHIEDHCNGLLLLGKDRVVNPATRQWSAFPPCPAQDCTRWNMWYTRCLVYDPMISPDYEVFMIPSLRDKDDRTCDEDESDLSMEESEWPPSPCKTYSFSSRTGCWEEKNFVREGDTTRTVGEMRVGWMEFENAVYFRRALYIHCRAGFLMRISLSDNAYRVTEPPIVIKVEDSLRINIVRSEKGVYFVAFEEDKCLLRVWILNESCGQMAWMLRHEKDLNPVLSRHRFHQRDRGHWILEDINYNFFCSSPSPSDIKETSTEQIYEWSSDNDDDHDVEDCYSNKESHDGNEYDIQILGFHPHKEIVFLSESTETRITGLAYHVSGSKIEVLGDICPKGYSRFNMLDDIGYSTSCPYTPCWILESSLDIL